MSNRRASNINQAIRKQELLLCFTEAIAINDSRNRRTAIGDAMRLATMYDVDDTLMLFHALKEKYEPLMSVEKRPNSLASPAPRVDAPKPLCREAMGASPQGASTRGEYKCGSCSQDFKSAKALSGHGPQRCSAKINQTI